MSVATESMEHAEHASHGAHGKGPGKYIGLTMATLGVLLAFCAAKVGSERTELTKSLVEQTQASAESQANQMKYRMVMLQLEESKAMLVSPATKTIDAKLIEEGKLIEAKTLPRLVELVMKYIGDKEANKAWVKAYIPLISAHFEAAEGYEHAQLSAEIGIVIASIALMLSSRFVWMASLMFGGISVFALGNTYRHSHHEIHETEAKVEEAKMVYMNLRKIHDPNKDDAQTIDSLDPGNKIRAQVASKDVELIKNLESQKATQAQNHNAHGEEHPAENAKHEVSSH